MITEIICCSLTDAIAARDGGADRLEICSRLDLQGLTPLAKMVQGIMSAVGLPARVMIRTNAGFTATEEELELMRRQVQSMASLPLDGIIFGLHDADGRLDFRAMDRLLEIVPASWGWTLHRAFDFAAGSTEEKMAAVAQHGRADHILTAVAWRLKPASNLQFIAGGGLSAGNLKEYLASPCREFHFGRAARTPEEVDAPVDPDKVRKLVDTVRKFRLTYAE